MDPGPAGERPLSEDERRALSRIEDGVRESDPEFPQRLGSLPGLRHPALRQVGRWPSRRELTVAGLAVCAYVTLLLLVPDDLVVTIVVITQLVLIPACCLLWAARRGQL